MTAPRPALETATMVRAGERAAVDVLEHHLAVIEAGEESVHAFNLVTGRPRPRAGPGRRRPGGRRRGPGPAGRGAGRPEGQPVHPGRAHHLLVAHPRGVAARPTTPPW